MQDRSVAIAANFTAEPVAESLSFWLREFGLPATATFAPFDQIFQQLLVPSSLLGANTAGANAVLVRLDLWLHAARETESDSATISLEAQAQELADAVRRASEQAAVPFVVMVCPADPRALANGQAEASLAEAEALLAATLKGTSNVQVVTSRELLAKHPDGAYFDADAEALGGISYTETFMAVVGTELARRVRAALAVPYKVLVLDCDNTLWRGVVGELGPMGVEVDDAFQSLQQFVVRQHEAGMLVCLCSKNNDADVRELFRLRSDMPLGWDRVVRSRINWEPKSENLKALAAELNLGLSSFVFVDDSAYEIAEVRQNCPEVLALQLPVDADGIRRFIEHTWVFDRATVTETDRLRAASYTQNLQRETVLKRAATLEDFLRDLDLHVKIRAPEAPDMDRAAQMTQRTNQFNLSTRRRSAPELRALLTAGTLEALIVDVRDRFGDYGTVGLMLFDAANDALCVDTMLLSCRALGRRVEHHMLARLGELAQSRGLSAIELPFVRSEKNTPALRFLASVTGGDASVTDDRTFTLTPDAACAAPSLPASNVDSEGAAAASADAAKTATAGADSSAAIAPAVDAALVTRVYTELYDPRRLVQALRSVRTVTGRDPAREIVAPRTPMEEALVGIWKDVLREDHLGVTDNFFDLGGNSLAAVPMFVRLRKQFRTALGPTTLLEAPTIAELAALLSGDRRSDQAAKKYTSLVPIQRGGARTPLFFVHAGAGTIFIYHQLAAALGPAQPSYGLQVVGLYDAQRAHATIEEMAAHYVRELRSEQPTGPYRLAGFCLGATIALEMALQLEHAGEEVSFLASFDGAAPGYRGGAKKSTVAAAAEEAPRTVWTKIVNRAYRIRNKILLSYTTRRGVAIPQIFQRASWYFVVNNMFAKMRYRPSESFAGRMHVFTIQGRYAEPTLGWSTWARGGVSAHEISGEFRLHRDLMRPPMVLRIAELLTPILDGDAKPARRYPDGARGIPMYNDALDESDHAAGVGRAPGARESRAPAQRQPVKQGAADLAERTRDRNAS